MTTSLSLEAAEAECAKGRTAPRVSLEDIKANVATEAFFTAGAAGEALGLPMHEAANLLTICIVTVKNGFTLVGKSAPASADNFDAELGQKLAYEDAIRQLWPLMGYALRETLS